MVVFLLTCGMMRAAAIAASAERPSWWEALPDEEWPSVDMLVRSHSGETAQLLLLLRSVEMYWPIEKWGVIVVLDEDPFDAALALTLPAFVRAFLEPPPSHWDAFAGVRRRMEGVEVPGSTRANFSDWDVAAESRGYVRAQWSHLNSDAYSDADFIAWVDTDCIFFTFVTPALLFSRDDAGSSAFVRRPSRPVVACGDAPIVYWPVIRVLGWPWVCEFMVGFPFVLHRGVFPTARAAIRAAFERRGAWGCEKSGYYRGAVDPECQMAPLAAPPDDEAFGEAFAWLGRATREGFARQLRDGALLPCAITILGHVAYLYDYDGHRFSVHHVPQDRSWPFDAIRQIFPDHLAHLGNRSGSDSAEPTSLPASAVSDALCSAVYCSDCPSLEWMLSMAHDGYMTTWSTDSMPGCPESYGLPHLLEEYKAAWSSITASAAAAAEMPAVFLVARSDSGHSPEDVAARLQLRGVRPYMDLLVP